MVLALVENLQRDDLNPMETARAYQRMAGEFGLTQDAIAHKVSRDRSSIANALRLLSLPEEVQEWIESDRLSLGHAKVILGLMSPDAQVQLARRIIEERLSVRDTERILQEGPHRRRRATRGTGSTVRTDLEERLQRRLGTRVHIEKGRRGGKIIIQYFSPEELDGVVEKILNGATSFS